MTDAWAMKVEDMVGLKSTEGMMDGQVNVWCSLKAQNAE